MRNVLLTLSYDGTCYFGWQKTKEGASIESCLEKAIISILQHSISLQAASRTDRGVHADGQRVNFFTQSKIPLPKLIKAINSLLPSDIRVLAAEEKDPLFHPTIQAISKEYHYKISLTAFQHPHLRFTHWHIPKPLDISLMETAIPKLIGKMNFACFRNQRKELVLEDTIRELYDINFEYRDDILTIKMTGDSFLYKMARNIVGTLVYVGNGKIKIQDIEQLLSHCDRTKAGITAPAHGLTLHKVFY